MGELFGEPVHQTLRPFARSYATVRRSSRRAGATGSKASARRRTEMTMGTENARSWTGVNSGQCGTLPTATQALYSTDAGEPISI